MFLERNIMKSKLLLFLLTGLIFTSTKVFSQDQNFYIFLCFGQSNMEGYPGVQQEDKTNVDDRFQVLAAVDFPRMNRTKGNWYPAVPPLCRGTQAFARQIISAEPWLPTFRRRSGWVSSMFRSPAAKLSCSKRQLPVICLDGSVVDEEYHQALRWGSLRVSCRDGKSGPERRGD